MTRRADISDFYNFSSIYDVTANADNYIDASHYSAYIGDMLIDAMINDSVDEKLYKQGFGWYITSENVDELPALPEMNGAFQLNRL